MTLNPIVNAMKKALSDLVKARHTAMLGILAIAAIWKGVERVLVECGNLGFLYYTLVIVTKISRHLLDQSEENRGWRQLRVLALSCDWSLDWLQSVVVLSQSKYYGFGFTKFL